MVLVLTKATPKRFSPFFSGYTKKTEYEGTGIGLSLVKKAVNNHNGEVRAVSTPGQGAAFYVILPV